MKTIGIAGAWIVTLVLAFLAGSILQDGDEQGPDATDESARLQEQVERLTAELDDAQKARERVEAGGRVRRAVEDPDAATVSPAPPTAADGADAAPVPTFSLEGATDGHEASREFMAFVESQFERGDAGHDAIMRSLGEVWKNRELMQQLFGDEASATRELYPWIRFLVQNETQMVSLTDYVFRTMAESPEDLAHVPDNDLLEIFTEGVGILLPGVVDDETLGVFRGYAEQILATPEDEQPQVVQQNRKRIEMLLARFWAKPVTPEEAFALLQSGDVQPSQVPRLLRQVPPDRMKELDLGSLVLPLLKEGNHEALGILAGNREGIVDAWRADQAVLEGLAAGKVHAWFLQQYFRSVGHDGWDDVRGFFDRALAADATSRAAAAQALSRYLQPNMRPDKAYVEDVLSRYEFEERTVALLKRVYGIEQ